MQKTIGYAAYNHNSPLLPFIFERRDPAPTDVQIEILFCGVCHSDIHQARNEWGSSLYPMVPGHEIVGTVTSLGNEVTGFNIGDRVGVGCLVDSCRICPDCSDHLEQFCNAATFTYNAPDKMSGGSTYGGYSSQIVVDQHFVLHISDKLDLAAAAPLLCAGITTYSPLRYWKVGKGHKLAVLGLGGLGHMAVKFGVAFGAEVTVLSTSPKKEADAKKLGAHHFVVTTDPAQVKSAKNSFDFILDTVSAEHDFNMYMSFLRTNGVHICVGVPPKPAEIAAFSLIGGRKSLAGSGIGGLAETQEMLDYCAKHNIVSDIEMIDIKDIQKAYDRMVKGDVRYRFVIDMATL